MKIKFVTLNIWEGGRLIDNIVSFIKKENPDIIAMQEVYDGKDPSFDKNFRSVEEFGKNLDYPYYFFAAALLDTRSIGDIEKGNAIFSKFPIVEKDVAFFDIPYGKFNEEKATSWEFEPRNMIHAGVNVKRSMIDVFNVHGIWGENGRDNKRRLKMGNIIVEKVKNKENVILAGDFNILPNTETIQNIEKYLANVFKNDLTSSFNMKHKDKAGYATSVVDMIFVSHNTQKRITTGSLLERTTRNQSVLLPSPR